MDAPEGADIIRIDDSVLFVDKLDLGVVKVVDSKGHEAGNEAYFAMVIEGRVQNVPVRRTVVLSAPHCAEVAAAIMEMVATARVFEQGMN